jgi:hypothetical protein
LADFFFGVFDVFGFCDHHLLHGGRIFFHSTGIEQKQTK